MHVKCRYQLYVYIACNAHILYISGSYLGTDSMWCVDVTKGIRFAGITLETKVNVKKIILCDI